MAQLERVLEDTLRQERARIVGGLVRLCGSLAAAEDALQEATLEALRAWPAGVPLNPAAWLTTTAKNRARDVLRHEAVAARAEASAAVSMPDESVDVICDDLLRLLFTCCHPALPEDGQIALTLKVVAGFQTAEIARFFVTSEDTVSQRILRARRTLEAQGGGYEAAVLADVDARADAVAGVVYAMFNEGHAATDRDLQAEALRLARLLADLLPGRPASHGLVALLALGLARAEARVDGEGVPVVLEAQDRSRWNRALIREGLIALGLARSLPGRSRYVVEAEIACAHMVAPTWAATDWAAIVGHYEVLMALAGSPVVALNRAIALAMRDGPAAGLAALASLASELASVHLFHAARASMLERLGRDPRPELLRALELVSQPGERLLLERRLAALR